MRREAEKGDKDGDADSSAAAGVGGCVLTTEERQAKITGEELHER